MLDNVLYSRAYTSEQQMELLDFVCAKFHEEPGVFKLLIVDSVMALFRVDYSGRGELADRIANAPAHVDRKHNGARLAGLAEGEASQAG